MYRARNNFKSIRPPFFSNVESPNFYTNYRAQFSNININAYDHGELNMGDMWQKGFVQHCTEISWQQREEWRAMEAYASARIRKNNKFHDNVSSLF